MYVFLKTNDFRSLPRKKNTMTYISELHATADVIKEKKPEVTKRKKSFLHKDKK